MKMAGRLWEANREACGCGLFKVLYEYQHKSMNADCIQFNRLLQHWTFLAIVLCIQQHSEGYYNQRRHIHTVVCQCITPCTLVKWVQTFSWNILPYLPSCWLYNSLWTDNLYNRSPFFSSFYLLLWYCGYDVVAGQVVMWWLKQG
jgi:hypothetical protein